MKLTLMQIKLTLSSAMIALLVGTGCATNPSPPTVPPTCTYRPGIEYCTSTLQYGDGTSDTLRDLSTDVAHDEAALVQAYGQHFSQKFELTAEGGEKIARTLLDYSHLESRTETDLLEFAKKRYGILPSELIVSVSRAQMGQPEALQGLIERAAQEFDTDAKTMKKIIHTFMGKQLEEQGISL